MKKQPTVLECMQAQAFIDMIAQEWGDSAGNRWLKAAFERGNARAVAAKMRRVVRREPHTPRGEYAKLALDTYWS